MAAGQTPSAFNVLRNNIRRGVASTIPSAEELAQRTARAFARGAIGATTIEAASKLTDLPGRKERAIQLDNLTFPSDLYSGTGNDYYMSLRFVKYIKRAITSRKEIETYGSINLPIPNGLVESTQVHYDTKELGTVVGSFIESKTGSMGNPLIDATSAFLVERAAAAAGSNVLPGASAISGLAINPFLTVIFKNPSFKTHNFSWKLIPRNEYESYVIKRIVDTIKYHMLPGLLTRSGVIFEYPEMLLIKLYPNDEYTYKFKPCVVKSFDVNYAPAGGPSFYKISGAPTAIEIKISLQEIEYFTKADYLDPSTLPQNFEQLLNQAGIAPLQPNVPGGPSLLPQAPSFLPQIPGQSFFNLFG